MTELAIWKPGEIVTPAEVPNSQLDDWIMVADKVVGLAKVIANSPFVPDGLRGSVPATAAAILTGRELGIPPMTSLANIHVIHGKPGLSALVMRALILAQGHEWRNVETTNTRCVVEGRRRGETEWTRASFSSDDATRAKIQLGGYPLDKLYARASARLARQKFADVIAGMPYSIEELEDGVTPDESTDVGATGPDSNGTAPAVEKPRTAQRRQRAQTSPPAPAAPPVAATPAPSGAGGDLPPLPGEEEQAAGQPGDERHRKLVGIVQQHFKRLEYTEDEREQRLEAAAIIANVDPIGSLNDLTPDDLSTVADTLARCRNRDALTALLVARDKAGDPREGGEQA